MDGANVEIADLVGGDNIYIFGASSGQVIHRYAAGDYDPPRVVRGRPQPAPRHRLFDQPPKCWPRAARKIWPA